MTKAKTRWTVELDQLTQLITVTKDGDLISKDATEALVNACLVSKKRGWNYLRTEGVQLLITLGLIRR